MKIELADNLDRKVIEEEIKKVEIVDVGDYVLYEKRERILVSDGFDTLYIFFRDIAFVEIVDGLLYIQTKNEKYTSTLPLHKFEFLPLIRINKSCLVNLDFIEDIKVKMNMKYSLKMSHRWFDVNRTYYASFKSALGL